MVVESCSREEFGLLSVPGLKAFHGMNGLDEFAYFLELAVDAGVADVGDGVDAVEVFHDVHADGAGIDFAEGEAFEFGDDGIGGGLELFEGDRAFFAGFDEAAEEFFATEGFASAGALDDDHFGAFDFLVGGEAEGAGEAFAASADGDAIAGDSGVDDFIVEVLAFGAAHSWWASRGTTCCGVNKIESQDVEFADLRQEWLPGSGKSTQNEWERGSEWGEGWRRVEGV